jgi:iron complex outermembrane receptor protein
LRERYADELAGLERTHALYRAEKSWAGGTTRLDVDANLLRQDPTSPYPRVATGLDPAIDTDANFHPADARIDENRYHVSLGHRRGTALGDWNTTLAVAHTGADVVRGYLAQACGPGASSAMNACGHTQDREVSDLYFDTHLITQLGNVTAVWGIDDLFGKGEQEARIFDYVVDPAHGNNAPASSDASTLEENELEDERNFFGAYGQLDWNASDTVSVVAGLRLNVTHETREGVEDLASGPVPSRQTRSDKEISGSFGVAWQAWSRGDDAITLFADYRDTFKPAAIDFGPEAEADILDPETAHASEVGIKSLWLGGRLNLELAGFDMTMKNLVVPQIVGGSPGLTNAGTLHLKGIESELRFRQTDNASLRLGFAHHELRFGDYLRLFDGTPVQLSGNAQELSPDDTGSIGIVYARPSGLIITADYAYTGERFLNKRNTSVASSFSVVDASLGYRFDGYEIRFAGHNLTDSRDPVSESELGDGQYYRMPARTVAVSLTADF